MKLYVGNLPFSVSNEDLKKHFESFGQITEAIVVMDKFSNRSKGFGFVTFSNDDEAKAAIAGLNEKDFSGRNIIVSEAKPMTESGDRDRNSNRGSFRNNRDSNRSFGNRNSNRRDSRRR